MDSPYTSEIFYHMVGWSILRDDSIVPEDKVEYCYRRLKEVIEFGFIAGADESGERIQREGDIRINIDSDGHLRNGDFEGFLAKGVITCFADIPWGSLGLHTGKYGMFGFGVSAAHLARAGARPVIYIPCFGEEPEWDFRGHALLNSMTTEIINLHNVVDEYEGTHNPEGESGWTTVDEVHQWSCLQNHLMRDVAAFIKPYDARLDIRHPECYYTEREWRLLGNVQIVPQKVPVIVVARGYRERLLQEVPIAREFEVRELGS
ncbi:abortive infection system antitoxin AbiGi family protein [Pseudomonas citronellolis]|uniref:abortive infection system antitoxin AbiGi family protein n=1 Tax=Pseudomonas citronellolis TaxID=53408 RepID=UPI00264A2738|nr:abortive infection system antitoxin AbiGi family protein [Pseudomonas citronellolis]MDN6871849.1 abortive infection system antitoxin AbiGi family protein [Pseudomonas citronellolis]